MSTPKLSTAVRSRIERRDRQAQTAFPAKVVSYKASTNVVELDPQFIETWVNRDGSRESEAGDARVTNVPVCFPQHISWTIDTGDFGLVICTKYSLDQWRAQRQPIDPGDLRRFTMSGATFHPVLMDEAPSGTQDFVALKADVDDIKTMLDGLKADYNLHKHTGVTTGPGSSGTTDTINTDTYTVTASSKVKVQ